LCVYVNQAAHVNLILTNENDDDDDDNDNDDELITLQSVHFYVQYDGLTQRVTRACPLRLLALRTFSSYCLGNIRRVVCEVGFIRSVSVRNTQVLTMTEAGRHSKRSAISATQSVRRLTS